MVMIGDGERARRAGLYVGHRSLKEAGIIKSSCKEIYNAADMYNTSL
jgi:hypothetical protein